MPDSKYAPKHRGAPPRRARTGATNAVKYSSIAAWATGIAVVGGVVAQGDVDSARDIVGLQSAGAGAAGPSDALAGRGEQAASRSADRSKLERAKAGALEEDNGVARVRTEDLRVADPRALARALMPEYGLSASEFSCLDQLWVSESDWDVHADNPTSSAYGIPQALPGSKMASAGADWEHNAETQIRWGLEYIRDSYGTACSAWEFKQGNNWY